MQVNLVTLPEAVVAQIARHLEPHEVVALAAAAPSHLRFLLAEDQLWQHQAGRQQIPRGDADTMLSSWRREWAQHEVSKAALTAGAGLRAPRVRVDLERPSAFDAGLALERTWTSGRRIFGLDSSGRLLALAATRPPGGRRPDPCALSFEAWWNIGDWLPPSAPDGLVGLALSPRELVLYAPGGELWGLTEGAREGSALTGRWQLTRLLPGVPELGTPLACVADGQRAFWTLFTEGARHYRRRRSPGGIRPRHDADRRLTVTALPLLPPPPAFARLFTCDAGLFGVESSGAVSALRLHAGEGVVCAPLGARTGPPGALLGASSRPHHRGGFLLASGGPGELRLALADQVLSLRLPSALGILADARTVGRGASLVVTCQAGRRHLVNWRLGPQAVVTLDDAGAPRPTRPGLPLVASYGRRATWDLGERLPTDKPGRPRGAKGGRGSVQEG